MKIATFNINNINKRLANLLAWLRSAKPDVVALQELKAADAEFPKAALEKAGYGAVWCGQKSRNGVAILARGCKPILTRTHLPGGGTDAQSRYIEAAVRGVLITSLYAPNGNPQPGPKFGEKLAWMRHLTAHAEDLYKAGIPVVLAGDYNVVPGSRYLSDQVLCQRRAASAGKPSAVSAHSRSRLGRRDPGPASRRADVYVLGLHAKPMGAGCRAAHRPLAAERASGGAADRCRRRS